jgi:hypothetical protein
LGFLFHFHPFVIGLVPCPSCRLAPYHVVLLYKEEQQGAPTPTITNLCLYFMEVNIPPPPIIASFHLHPFVIGLFVYRSSSLFLLDEHYLLPTIVGLHATFVFPFMLLYCVRGMGKKVEL